MYVAVPQLNRVYCTLCLDELRQPRTAPARMVCHRTNREEVRFPRLSESDEPRPTALVTIDKLTHSMQVVPCTPDALSSSLWRGIDLLYCAVLVLYYSNP